MYVRKLINYKLNYIIIVYKKSIYLLLIKLFNIIIALFITHLTGNHF